MYKILILICANALAVPDCQIDTARATVQGPKVASAMRCAFEGQAMLAPTAVAPKPGEEYAKTVCRRVVSEVAAAAP